MSSEERLQLLLEEESPEDVAKRVSENTLPGPSNDPFIDGLGNAMRVVPRVIVDLKNWFRIIDVRVHGEREIGMPMEYRWTIVRWAENEMDNWLIDRGWENIPHLKADTREREVNELEARYVKQFGEVDVFANFIVEFPDRVFRELNDSDIEEARERMEKEQVKQEKVAELIKARRS